MLRNTSDKDHCENGESKGFLLGLQICWQIYLNSESKTDFYFLFLLLFCILLCLAREQTDLDKGKLEENEMNCRNKN